MLKAWLLQPSQAAMYGHTTFTCSWRQVEDKYSQDAGEDAGHDDVNDVE